MRVHIHTLPRRRLWAVVLAGVLVVATVTPTRAAHSAVSTVGASSTWRLALLHIRSMSAIPHVTWRGKRGRDLYPFYRMFVLTVQLTNTGARRVAPYDDLALVLKVMPPYKTAYVPGWAQLPRTGAFTEMYHEAAHLYGGEVPWAALAPRATATYCYVIATNRGDAHYGLYNALPYKQRVFLLDTGL